MGEFTQPGDDHEDHDEEEEEEEDHTGHDEGETVSIVSLAVPAGTHRVVVTSTGSESADALVYLAVAEDFPYPRLPEGGEAIETKVTNVDKEAGTADLVVTWAPIDGDATYCVYVHDENNHAEHHVHSSFCAVNYDEEDTISACGITETSRTFEGLNADNFYHVDIVATETASGLQVAYIGEELSTAENTSSGDDESEIFDTQTVVIIAAVAAVILLGAVFCCIKKKKSGPGKYSMQTNSEISLSVAEGQNGT